MAHTSKNDLPVASVKTGMLAQEDVIRLVADKALPQGDPSSLPPPPDPEPGVPTDR